MGRGLRITIGLVVVLAVVGVLTVRQPAPQGKPAVETTAAEPAAPGLPTLVELGSEGCVPCEMMARVLDELRRHYPATLHVVFHDVNKNPAAGTAYRIGGIPTQVFLNGKGEEVARHFGYLSEEDVVATFKKCGIDLGEAK